MFLCRDTGQVVSSKISASASGSAICRSVRCLYRLSGLVGRVFANAPGDLD